MKLKKHLISMILITVLCLSTFSTAILANDNDNKAEKTIRDMFNYINKLDVKGYINLFNSENQAFMLDAAKSMKPEEFFMERQVKIVNLKKIDFPLAATIASISAKEGLTADNTEVYYTELDFKVDKQQKYMFNGSNFRVIVLAKDSNEWKVVSMSVPPMQLIEENNMGFGSKNEKDAIARQKHIMETGDILDNCGTKISSIAYNSSVYLLSTHTYPSTIQVYLTKPENISYYDNLYRIQVDFTQYLTDVLPKEWIAEWYTNNPESVRAGAICVKMYGWYHTIYPKRQYAPYYSDVLDNSNDQNYLAGSRNSNTTSALNDMSTIGLETASGNLFELQYVAGTSGQPGTQYSGTATAYGTWYWSKQSKVCEWMMHYYFDKCHNTGNDGELVRYFYY